MSTDSSVRGISTTVFTIALLAALAVGFTGGWLVRDARGPDTEGRDDRQERAMATEIDELKAKLAKEPKDAAGWTRLGHLYFDSGHPAEAVEAYSKSLELAPGNPDVLTDMGVMYRELGQSAKAIECFDKAIALKPGHEIARFNKGIVLLADLGDTAGALAVFEELLRINPSAKSPSGMPVSELVNQLRQQGQAAAPAPKAGPPAQPQPKPGMLIGK